MSNHFQLLQLPIAFNLDIHTLESAYFAAQRQWHPDRFVGKSAAERQAALHHSMDINHAYDTLKNPLKRAQHLLQLHGMIVLDEANTVKPDNALLMEIMELQDQLSEGRTPEFNAEIQKRITVCEDSLAKAFNQIDYEAAKQYTMRLSYLYKLANR